MTDKFEEKAPSGKIKSKQPLSYPQKLLFGIFCWGVQSWGQAANFKAQGYDQKNIDARKAMCTGLVVYGISIMLLILLLLYYN
jgi:hypothetical protein